MKLSQLLSLIATEIAGNAAIESFCQTNYGKSVTIKVHADKKDPSKIGEAPWVGLTILGYDFPTGKNRKIQTFSVESAAYLEDKGETTVGKVTTLDGFAKIEDFSDLVFAAISKAVSTTASQTNMTLEGVSNTDLIIPENGFPGWLAMRSWNLGHKF